eukprot:10734453-Lingulodinium_polyedra.AAC.1
MATPRKLQLEKASNSRRHVPEEEVRALLKSTSGQELIAIHKIRTGNEDSPVNETFPRQVSLLGTGAPKGVPFKHQQQAIS